MAKTQKLTARTKKKHVRAAKKRKRKGETEKMAFLQDEEERRVTTLMLFPGLL